MDAILQVRNLTAGYEGKPVIWGIYLEVPRGSLCAIVGPNGAGKSTLLKALVGLLPVWSGEVRIAGRSPREVLSRIAYLPQKEEVDWTFPARVVDVVAMGRVHHHRWFFRLTRRDREMIQRALEMVELQDLQYEPVAHLSGGQKQRVFFARALAQEPDLFLMDEPFAGIDATTEQLLLDRMKALARQGKTFLIVHHNLFTVLEHFDRVFLLQQVLIASGSPEEVLTSENIQRAYGGRVPLLERLAHQLQRYSPEPGR